jgi:YfiH family protein
MTLDVIKSDALDGIRHGFFARKGGASSGIYAGLNCGYGSSDQQNIVRINRERVADHMEVSLEAMRGVHQIHSADVVTVERPSDEKPKADAMVTNVPGIALSILTADCQPVLFADQDAGVIGAAHAGWKGAVDGVLENTLAAMQTLGARIENTTAVIGPSISQAAYEVGPEFLEQFIDENSENSRFFANGEKDRYQFDLPAFGVHKLRNAGVKLAEWTGHCTYSNEERFYSYRRSFHRKEPDYGRLISAICL